jgi:hypothetical protein
LVGLTYKCLSVKVLRSVTKECFIVLFDFVHINSASDGTDGDDISFGPTTVDPSVSFGRILGGDFDAVDGHVGEWSAGERLFDVDCRSSEDRLATFASADDGFRVFNAVNSLDDGFIVDTLSAGPIVFDNGSGAIRVNEGWTTKSDGEENISGEIIVDVGEDSEYVMIVRDRRGIHIVRVSGDNDERVPGGMGWYGGRELVHGDSHGGECSHKSFKDFAIEMGGFGESVLLLILLIPGVDNTRILPDLFEDTHSKLLDDIDTSLWKLSAIIEGASLGIDVRVSEVMLSGDRT